MRLTQLTPRILRELYPYRDLVVVPHRSELSPESLDWLDSNSRVIARCGGSIGESLPSGVMLLEFCAQHRIGPPPGFLDPANHDGGNHSQ